jgi:hypothetical protein
MNKTLLAVALLVTFQCTGMALAQAPELVSPSEEVKSYLVATVNVHNVQHVQSGHQFNIAFDIMNRIGTQAGVRYGALLMKDTKQGPIIVDAHLERETLTLEEGGSVRRAFTYTAPAVLGGTFNLYLISEGETGLQYGFVPLGEITLVPSVAGVLVDTESCYLTIGAEGTRYEQSTRVDLASNESLMSHCTIENTSDEATSIRPQAIVREYGIFGPLANLLSFPAQEPITLASKEKRDVSVLLPLPAEPGNYITTLSFGPVGNEVYHRFVIQGARASIDNVVFDKAVYAVGETALLSITWSSAGDSIEGTRAKSAVAIAEPSITVIVSDAGGRICAEPISNSIEQYGSPAITVPVIMTQDCIGPTAEVIFADKELGILARSTYAVKTVNGDKPNISSATKSVDISPIKFGIPLAFSLVGLLLGLGLFIYRAYMRKKESVLTTPIVGLFLLIVGAFSLSVHDASADTFNLQYGNGASRKNFTVSASLVDSDLTPSDFLQVQGTIQHTNGSITSSFYIYLYYNIDGGFVMPLYDHFVPAGVNFWTSPWNKMDINTPPFPGNHTIKVTADVNSTGVTLPFTISGAFYAPCSPTVINDCVLPSAPHNTASGMCSDAGTCQYSCNDGTWGLFGGGNHNFCYTAGGPELIIEEIQVHDPEGGGGDPTVENSPDDSSRHAQAPLRKVWSEMIENVGKFFASMFPPRASAAVMGDTLNLQGFFSNIGGNTGVGFTSGFYYQWGGTGGVWTEVPGSLESWSPVLPGQTYLLDEMLFTVPLQTGSLYIRFCVDIYDEVNEGAGDGPFANCVETSEIYVSSAPLGSCSSTELSELNDWKNKECPLASGCASTPICYTYPGDKNLVTNIAGPTSTDPGVATELFATVHNNGELSSGSSFVNLFQVADDDQGNGAVDIGTQTTSPLGGLGKAIVKFDYVFPASAAGTNKFIRVCADKSSASSAGVIAEANELLVDNCGPWNSILIKPACSPGEELTWTDSTTGKTCSALTPQGTKGGQSTLNDTTAPDTGTAQFSCKSNGQWEQNPELGATCNQATVMCPAGQTLSWSGGQCSGTTQATAENGTFSMSDSEIVTSPGTGGATFKCLTGGTWAASPEAVPAAVCGTVCPGGALNWNTGGNSCSGTVAVTLLGSTAPVIDNVADPATGGATFLCQTDRTWKPTPESGTDSCTIPATNQAPIITKGNDFVNIGLPTDYIALVGWSAVDPESGTLNYTWVPLSWPPAGSPGSISNASVANPTFQNLAEVGTYTFQLTVTDNQGATDVETFTVNVSGTPPPDGTISTNDADNIVDQGDIVQLTWDAWDYPSSCKVEGTNGQLWNYEPELSGVSTLPLNANTAFGLYCYDTQVPPQWKPISSVFITVNPDVDLWVTPSIVGYGDAATLSWNTNGNDPATCSFSGGGLSPVVSDGNGSQEITNIQGQISVKLTCGLKNKTVQILMRPQSYEP